MIRGTKAIFLAVLVMSTTITLPAEAQNTGCRSKPKSGVTGFLKGLADRASRRIVGTGVLGDAIVEGRKLLSDTIACALSDAENKQAVAAQQRALNGGKTGKASRTEWTSKEREGVRGGTEIATRTRREGQECAVQRTFITDVNGEQKSVDRELCQEGNGSWREV